MLLRCRKRRSDASLALAPAAKIDSQGTHQGAPPFPVVHQEGLHERGKAPGPRSEPTPREKGSAGVLSEIPYEPAIGEAILTGERISC